MMTPYRIALLTLLLVAAVPGQQILYQTLPAGWEAQEGNSTTAFPLNTASDQVWQWHYDAGEFAASGPITITHLAMRSKAGFVIQAFNFPSFEVTFIEASTEHTTSSHQAEFAANILRSQLVRSGSWSSVALFPLPFSTVGGFAEMGLDEPFVYDPSTGNDLIIQVRKCGTNLVWGTMVDAAAGTGGNRYGHTSDCLATTQNFNNTNVVPIVRIGYHLARQTLPQGYMTTDGNGSSGQPFTPTGDQKWQWHYDSDEFEVQGPIAIRQIWVRPRHPSENLGAFSFNALKVTLGSSTTHYAPGFHASTFSVNLDQQEIVRRGTWSGGPVAPSANTTADWVSLNLGQGYVYDPSTGRDFVVQIEKCGPANHWSTTLDGILAAAGTGGGCRYGNTTSCTALDDNTPAANDFVPIIRIDYEPVTSANEVVVRFPYREDFDDSAIGNVPPRGWHNQEGENVDPPGDWVIATGSTPSLNTGPTADHTTGISNYVYVEDSLSDNPRVVLTTPVFDLTGLANPRISFWLHSQNAGGGVSTLDLEVVELPSGHATGLLPLPFGATGPTWVEQTFDLSPYQGLRVAIRFTVNNDNVGFYHDVAID
ncbi:MAG: hypothetical protein KDB53_02855, partial [Planctomycetes bacterium]|nr:hypothetical protein [Planctomycetota bacterium]